MVYLCRYCLDGMVSAAPPPADDTDTDNSIVDLIVNGDAAVVDNEEAVGEEYDHSVGR